MPATAMFLVIVFFFFFFFFGGVLNVFLFGGSFFFFNYGFLKDFPNMFLLGFPGVCVCFFFEVF